MTFKNYYNYTNDIGEPKQIIIGASDEGKQLYRIAIFSLRTGDMTNHGCVDENELVTFLKHYNLIEEEKNKMKSKGHVHCPVNGWDCPYWDTNGYCTMYPESNPAEECDDFAYFWNKDDDFVCYDDHEKE